MKAEKANLNCDCATKRCSPCEVRHIYPSRARQFRTKISNHFQIDAVSPFTGPMKPYRFENAPLLKTFSKRSGSDNELDRRRVNESRNRIEIDAVTNETASV